MKWALLFIQLSVIAGSWLENRFPPCREACEEQIPQLDQEKLEAASNFDELNEVDSTNRAKCMRICLITRKTGDALTARLTKLHYSSFTYLQDEDY